MPPQDIGQNKKNINIVWIIASFVVVLGLSYYAIQNKENFNRSASTNNTKENIDIQNVNLSSVKNDADKIPQGFPNDIPLEIANITGGQRADFVDRGVTQYTVSYNSALDLPTKYSEYVDFASKAGYSFVSDGYIKTESSSGFYATKGNDSITVLVAEAVNKKGVLVQITYLDDNQE